ncbi:unnamed protein product, partial [Trichogramma brassicae]
MSYDTFDDHKSCLYTKRIPKYHCNRVAWTRLRRVSESLQVELCAVERDPEDARAIEVSVRGRVYTYAGSTHRHPSRPQKSTHNCTASRVQKDRVRSLVPLHSQRRFDAS